MNTATVNGLELEFSLPEENPMLFARLMAECERKNNSDPTLTRLSKNTWARKKIMSTNPYPSSYAPSTTKIEPCADGMKL